MVNAETLKVFKKGSVLVNTGRGLLIDTKAAIVALKNLETLHSVVLVTVRIGASTLMNKALVHGGVLVDS